MSDRFWETSGCLNIARPSNLKSESKNLSTTTTMNTSTKLSSKRYKYLDELNVKIDLENFMSSEFEDSKYVITSPRSLEACAQLKIKPLDLLPKSLADIQDDLGGEKIPLRVIYQVYDEYEVERKEKLERAKQERLKIMKIDADNPSTFKAVSEAAMDKTLTKLNQLKDLITKHKQLTEELHTQDDNSKQTDSNYLRSSSAVSFKANEERKTESEDRAKKLEEFENFVSSLQEDEKLKLLESVLNKSATRTSLNSSQKIEAMQKLYAKNLDNLRDKTESSFYKHLYTKNLNEEEKKLNDTESNTTLNKRDKQKAVSLVFNESNLDSIKQNELVRAHFEREAKQAKALLNAKKIEEETELYRKKLLIKELMHERKAADQREKFLREKSTRVFGNRKVREKLQEDNFKKIQEEETLKKLIKLSKMQYKENQTKEFVKKKEESIQVSRILAKSSQDLRELYKDKSTTFDKMASKAELTSLIGKGFHGSAKNTSSVIIS